MNSKIKTGTGEETLTTLQARDSKLRSLSVMKIQIQGTWARVGQAKVQENNGLIPRGKRLRKQSKGILMENRNYLLHRLKLILNTMMASHGLPTMLTATQMVTSTTVNGTGPKRRDLTTNTPSLRLKTLLALV